MNCKWTQALTDQAVPMRYRQGLTFREIARRLGVPVTTVRDNLWRLERAGQIKPEEVEGEFELPVLPLPPKPKPIPRPPPGGVNKLCEPGMPPWCFKPGYEPVVDADRLKQLGVW